MAGRRQAGLAPRSHKPAQTPTDPHSLLNPMSASSEESPQSGYRSWAFLLGLLGVAGAFSLLPKAVRRGFRRFLFGVFFEITVVALAGLFTERMVRRIAGEDEEAHLPEPPRHR